MSSFIQLPASFVADRCTRTIEAIDKYRKEADDAFLAAYHADMNKWRAWWRGFTFGWLFKRPVTIDDDRKVLLTRNENQLEYPDAWMYPNTITGDTWRQKALDLRRAAMVAAEQEPLMWVSVDDWSDITRWG